MVMYRPHKPRNLTQPASVELPPSYESLFMSESPPSYTIAASEATEEASAEEAAPATSVNSNTQPPNAVLEDNNEHCQCDCDHSKCQNAS
jgi:hypothetical protein